MQFGLYMVRNGMLDCEQFVHALEQQLASRPQLGSLAIETGKLSVKQVFQILRLQCDAPGELFGELAVKLGFITEEELAGLIFLQSVRQQPMSEIIIENGVASESEVQESLANYRNREHSASADNLMAAC